MIHQYIGPWNDKDDFCIDANGDLFYTVPELRTVFRVQDGAVATDPAESYFVYDSAVGTPVDIAVSPAGLVHTSVHLETGGDEMSVSVHRIAANGSTSERVAFGGNREWIEIERISPEQTEYHQQSDTEGFAATEALIRYDFDRGFYSGKIDFDGEGRIFYLMASFLTVVELDGSCYYVNGNLSILDSKEDTFLLTSVQAHFGDFSIDRSTNLIYVTNFAMNRHRLMVLTKNGLAAQVE